MRPLSARVGRHVSCQLEWNRSAAPRRNVQVVTVHHPSSLLKEQMNLEQNLLRAQKLAELMVYWAAARNQSDSKRAGLNAPRDSKETITTKRQHSGVSSPRLLTECHTHVAV